MAQPKLISIVEDDAPFRESMRKLMTVLGYTVEVFPSARDFLAACRTEVYSMIANDDFACANVHRALDRVQSALFRS
jgi:FixJ family two-component response regulator